MARRVITIKDRLFTVICFIIIFFCTLMMLMIGLTFYQFLYFLKTHWPAVGHTYPSIQWLPLVKRPQREAPNAMIKNAWNYMYPLQRKHGVVLNQCTGALFLHVPFRLLLCRREPNHYHDYFITSFLLLPLSSSFSLFWTSLIGYFLLRKLQTTNPPTWNDTFVLSGYVYCMLKTAMRSSELKLREFW